tara:strand:+ start:493 stop:855 length:363 start_codon:yes stop_codon:yes gene_type:complete
MIWEQVIKYHKNSPNIQICRNKESQKQYDMWLKNRENIKNLKNNLFKNNQTWIITINKYPYYFSDNTMCYVLWSKEYIDYDTTEHIIKKYTDFKNYIYFTNKDNNKSIPEIYHTHIFVKS